MRVPLLSLKRAMRSISAGEFFETNDKMVLINDDQCDIADIVLDVWYKVKENNHPSTYSLDFSCKGWVTEGITRGLSSSKTQ